MKLQTLRPVGEMRDSLGIQSADGQVVKPDSRANAGYAPSREVTA